MVKKDIMDSLGFLGLSEKESSIYIYVCSNPNTTAGRIIKELGIALALLDMTRCVPRNLGAQRRGQTGAE